MLEDVSKFFKLFCVFEYFMSIDLYVHIVERPDNFDYPVKFKEIYGFTEHDCERAIKSFTDNGFVVEYTGKTQLKNGEEIIQVSQQVNSILEFSNRINELDKRSLDALLR